MRNTIIVMVFVVMQLMASFASAENWFGPKSKTNWFGPSELELADDPFAEEAVKEIKPTNKAGVFAVPPAPVEPQDCPGGVCPPNFQAVNAQSNPVYENWQNVKPQPVVYSTVQTWGNSRPSNNSNGGFRATNHCHGSRPMMVPNSCIGGRSFGHSRRITRLFSNNDQEHLRHHGYSDAQIASANDQQLIAMHEAAHGNGGIIRVSAFANRPRIFQRFQNRPRLFRRWR